MLRQQCRAWKAGQWQALIGRAVNAEGKGLRRLLPSTQDVRGLGSVLKAALATVACRGSAFEDRLCDLSSRPLGCRFEEFPLEFRPGSLKMQQMDE